MSNFCSIDGCEELVYCKGRCKHHYHIWYKSRKFGWEVDEFGRREYPPVDSLVGEIWRDIPGFNGKYQASNLGRVKRVSHDVLYRDGRIAHLSEKLIASRVNQHGYYDCPLTNGNTRKKYFVHRLVLSAFSPIEGWEDKQVNHKNGVKTDNRLENLEWVTNQENQLHRVYELGKEATIPKKAIVCVETGEIFPSLASAARKYGHSKKSHLTQVLSPKYPTIHTYKGYHWKFLDEL